MAINFLVVHLKIWFDMFKYDDAERRFYEQINWPVAGTRHVSPVHQVKQATPAEDDGDNDIDLFGSDNEEEDKDAAQLREEWLRQYTEKGAEKPVLVAKSSILLDVKPWDHKMDMASLETCVHSIQLDRLVVPVGYGIRKLQIQCVVEDDKVGIDLLEEEEETTKEHVQSVDTAGFNTAGFNKI
uniref:Translation elongation factor EF1B beta/delta subunit guanine nucleotide exchange domain-containing protein n=1 Tax=Aotus nancymaae TaxID=37293 RepID=A0A2K5CUY6_AOTNA